MSAPKIEGLVLEVKATIKQPNLDTNYDGRLTVTPMIATLVEGAGDFEDQVYLAALNALFARYPQAVRIDITDIAY